MSQQASRFRRTVAAPGPTSHRGPISFAQTLERALAQLPAQRSLAAGGTLAGLLGLLPGCDPAGLPPGEVPSNTAALRQEVIAFGQRDWAQNMGTHDTSMVSYYNESWYDLTNCNTRYGCLSITVFIKVKVKPVAGADLGYKKVGAVYREVGSNDPITANGYYFTTLPDGMEEWHVPIQSTTHSGTFTFDAWYEDGAGGRYYDDNNGELYALRWRNDGYDYSTLSQDFAATNAVFDATGVKGVIGFTVEDLNYDKELMFIYSTDGWMTSQTLSMGTGTDTNILHWVKNVSRDFESWQISLDLPGAFTTFQYKLVYRHGIADGAEPIEFTLGNLALPRS
jgi:hypothetical protein